MALKAPMLKAWSPVQQGFMEGPVGGDWIMRIATSSKKGLMNPWKDSGLNGVLEGGGNVRRWGLG